MAIKDFRAKRIRTHAIIGSGSARGFGSGGTPGLMIYSASAATDFSGTTDPVTSTMLAGVGKDVFLFVSGTNSTGSIQRGTAGAAVTLFGGDVVVSGTLFADKMVIEVEENVTGSLFVSGALFVSRSATIADGATITVTNAGTSPILTIGDQGNELNSQYLDISGSDGNAWARISGVKNPAEDLKAVWGVFDTRNSFFHGDTAFFGGGSDSNLTLRAGNADKFVITSGTYARNTGKVLILSGGWAHHPDEQSFTDLSFFVSGSIGGRGGSDGGVGVFGGDLVVSGALTAIGGATLALYDETPDGTEVTPRANAGGNSICMGDSSLIANGTHNVCGGGYYNIMAPVDGFAVVAGGSSHSTATTAGWSVIGGGLSNTVRGTAAVIGGGAYNLAGDNYSTIGGGEFNLAEETRIVIGGGAYNTASGDYCTIGGGSTNIAGSAPATDYATVGGGFGNVASWGYSTVGGGGTNLSNDDATTVGGGLFNTASDDYATVGGGRFNVSDGYGSFVGGGVGNYADNQWTSIPGGRFNTASANYAAVGGGFSNVSDGYAATVGGGVGNFADNQWTTIPGGRFNTASADYAAIGGGYLNLGSGLYATIGGGLQNWAGAFASVIAGGQENTGSGDYSAILGGLRNYIDINGDYGVILGGSGSSVTGRGSLAFGSELTASEDHTIHFGGPNNGDASLYKMVVSGVLKVTGYELAGEPAGNYMGLVLGNGITWDAGDGTGDAWIYEDGGDLFMKADNVILSGTTNVQLLPGRGGQMNMGADWGTGRTDVLFAVTGSAGSKNSPTRGTSVFEGDVVISGTLHGGDGVAGQGPLIVSGGLWTSGSDTSIQYHNFGDEVGFGGFGFRSNLGVMQLKDNAGSWADFSAGGGGGGADVGWFGPALSEITTTGSLGVGTLAAAGVVATATTWFTSQGKAVFNDHGQATGDFRVEQQGKMGAILSDAGTTQIALGSGGTSAANSYGLDSATVAIPTDMALWVSGAVRSKDNVGALGVAAFGGDTVISGTLYVSGTASSLFERGLIINASRGEAVDGNGLVVMGGISQGISKELITAKPDQNFVHILSGGLNTAQSPNPYNWSDTAFFVSGTIGSKDSNIKGTSVFGGDVVISGTLHGGEGASQAPLVVSGGLHLKASTPASTIQYIHFGTATGNAGYGFRSNTGTVQFKSSGGTWTDVGSGGTAADADWMDMGHKLITTSSVSIDNNGNAADVHGADQYFHVSGTIGRQGSSIAPKRAVIAGDLITSGSVSLGAGSRDNAARVLLLSGGAEGSVDESAGQDISFYVSGAVGAGGAINRGVALFGGDVVMSGGLQVQGGSTSGNTLSRISAPAGRDGFLEFATANVIKSFIKQGSGGNLIISNDSVGGDVELQADGSALYLTLDGATNSTIAAKPIIANMGLSGSLTKLTDGTSYLIAGTNVTITSASNGAVTIDSAGAPGLWTDGGGFIRPSDVTDNVVIGATTLVGADILFGVDGSSHFNKQQGSNGNFQASSEIKTHGIFLDAGTDQVFILSGSASESESTNPALATDIAFYVSGAIGSKGTVVKGVSAFGGDLHVSGSTVFDGTVVVNNPQLPGSNFKVKSQTSNAAIYVDAATDAVGFFTDTPINDVHIVGGSNVSLGLEENHASDDAFNLTFKKSRGTNASPAIVQDGDELGEIWFMGHDGSNYETGAKIRAFVDGSPGDDTTDMPGRLQFETSPDGEDTPVARIDIRSSGYVLINSGSGAAESPDELTFTDTNFFVSGSRDARFSTPADPGRVAVFGGDLIVSGAIYQSDFCATSLYTTTDCDSGDAASTGTEYAVLGTNNYSSGIAISNVFNANGVGLNTTNGALSVNSPNHDLRPMMYTFTIKVESSADQTVTLRVRTQTKGGIIKWSTPVACYTSIITEHSYTMLLQPGVEPCLTVAPVAGQTAQVQRATITYRSL